MAMIRNTDSNYTADEVSQSAKGYAMEYIDKVKEELDDTVSDISNDVSGLTDGLAATDSNVAAITARIGTAENTITDHESRLDAAQSDIDSLQTGKVNVESGKSLSENDYTSAEKTKLAGIEAGAQVNSVNSVAGKTGAVTLAKSDVGLGNVDNTSDANKPISTATQAAISTLQSDIDTLESLSDSLDGRITTTEGDIETLNTDVSSVQADLTAHMNADNPHAITAEDVGAYTAQEAIEMFCYKNTVSVLNNSTIRVHDSVAEQNSNLAVTAGTDAVTINSITTVGKNFFEPTTISNATAYTVLNLKPAITSKLQVGKYYCIYSPNCSALTSDTTAMLLRYLPVGADRPSAIISSNVGFTFLMTQAMKDATSIQIYYKVGSSVYNQIKMQITEVASSTATDYAFEEYSPEVKTLSTPLVIAPNSTESLDMDIPKGVSYITLDADNVPSKLECSYYEDINAKINEITNAIISLGGNV